VIEEVDRGNDPETSVVDQEIEIEKDAITRDVTEATAVKNIVENAIDPTSEDLNHTNAIVTDDVIHAKDVTEIQAAMREIQSLDRPPLQPPLSQL
jgi:hypothetical protein